MGTNSHITFHIVVVGMAAAVVAIAARSADAQNPADPCAQVTTAQISAALGETVGAGKQGPPRVCTWIAEKPKHQVVTLTYSPLGDWDRRKSHVAPGLTHGSVSGLGDDSLVETAANFTTLYVKKGATTFMVRVYGVSDAAKQLEIEKPIAQAALSKI
jgi:hypothetical protein